AHAAIFLDGAEAQAFHGAPRTPVVIRVVVGVGGMPAEQYRCRHGDSEQNDAHGSSFWPKASLISSYYSTPLSMATSSQRSISTTLGVVLRYNSDLSYPRARPLAIRSRRATSAVDLKFLSAVQQMLS